MSIGNLRGIVVGEYVYDMWQKYLNTDVVL